MNNKFDIWEDSAKIPVKFGFNARAYLIFVDCVYNKHSKWAKEIWDKYKDEFPSVFESTFWFNFSITYQQTY